MAASYVLAPDSMHLYTTWGRGRMGSAASPGGVFAAGVAEGVLRYQNCDACGRAVFYPRFLCPFCGSLTLTWRESAGRGSVYAQTWVHSRSGGYSVALVDLDEGFRLMSSIVGADPGDIATGMRVLLDTDVLEGEPRLVFRLVGHVA